MSSVSQRLGKYELQEPLGRGGMAEVWKALDTQLRRFVAIKFLHADLSADPDFVNRFMREAQMIAALRHPNIVQIYDFHLADMKAPDSGALDALPTVAAAPMGFQAASVAAGAAAYMVMEYIQGQTLGRYMSTTSRKKEFPTASTIVRLFTPISMALDYAHQQGTIHRDIKPANILLDATNTTRNPMGEPILSDFGLAKLLTGSSQTLSGAVLGTPLYMSPEQVQNKPLTEKSDLYSLGVVLYEVLTGVPPFQGDSMAGILMQHVTATPVAADLLNPNLPAAVSGVLGKCLAKDPRDRYESASAMVVALARALDVPVPDELRSPSSMQEATSATLPVGVPAGGADEARAESSSDADLATLASNGSDIRPHVLPMLEPHASNADPTVAASSEPPRSRPLVTSSGTPPPGSAVAAPASASSAPPFAPVAVLTESRPPTQPERTGPFANRSIRTLLLGLLVVVVLGGAIGAYAVVLHQRTSNSASTTRHGTAAANAPVGQALFVSSGQTSVTGNQGENDEVQVNLTGIPAAKSGKSYYAWLLPDLSQSDGHDLLLGKLAVNQGTVHFLYPGDSQHTNLLATMSRFVVTQESSDATPQIPTPDLSAWVYYAQLAQTAATGQQYSLLDHLRHLLAVDPELDPLHLQGGLNIWTYRNTQQVFQAALSVQTDANEQKYYLIHNQLVTILDYLDGSGEVKTDVPSWTPVLADQRASQVGLLELQPGKQNPDAYLYHIAVHLNGVLQSPGSTAAQRSEATKINDTLNNVTGWLGQMRQDAKQLFSMSSYQLSQPNAVNMLNDMVTQATNAYQGTTDPATGQTRDGVSQLYPAVQTLAALSVAPYKR